MRPRTIEWLIVAALATTPGCYGRPDPHWLLDEEQPLALGHEIEVVVDGPLAQDLPPIPNGRARKEPLPLDVVMIEPIIASRDGVLSTEDFVPAWFMCPARGPCVRALLEPHARKLMMRPCTSVISHTAGCLAGFANPLPLLWPMPEPDGPLSAALQRRMLMVGPNPGETTTPECLEWLEDGSATYGCVLYLFTVRLGPQAQLAELVAELYPDTFEVPELPEDEEPILPDFAPEPLAVDVYIDGVQRTLLVGQTVHVPAGARVRIDPYFDPADEQNVYLLGSEVRLSSERISHDLFFDEPVYPAEPFAPEFIVPAEGLESFTAFVMYEDGRNGRFLLEVPFVVDP